MTTLLALEYGTSRAPGRPGPPVGLALATFVVAFTGLLVLAGAEVAGPLTLSTGTSSQFGVVATTTFAIGGVLVAHRALAIRNGWVAAMAALLLGPGAAWSWLTFVGQSQVLYAVNSTVVFVACTMAILLTANGIRSAHWLEVFGGLSSLGLGMVAALIRFQPAAASSGSLALLAAVAGMTGLYGVLIDLEVAEHRSLIELTESRKRVEDEVSRVEDLLHDLRSGLLAIEAAIGSFDGDLAAPLQAEAARLRRLTLTGARTINTFDLADRLGNLVATRQAAGGDISLQSPESAMAWGEESEVLAIVDNLLSNAERHGNSGPIVVDLAEGEHLTQVSVSSPGQLPAGDPEAIFGRGVSTHPAGQGLGLARARMLAGVNGAELRVRPAVAGQTTFVLTLRSHPPVAVA
ncbi:MAG: HAMP domain-containing histidine kinase [Actinomycetia bacterium]|nr:HAMP domain-containing histidine kinase [Actinomycetes bacterium]